MRLFRVIVPVEGLDAARSFYTTLLDEAGVQVSPGRHYYRLGDVTLALYNPAADGDTASPRPNFEHLYFAVDDLEAVFRRAERLGALSTDVGDGGLPMGQIARRPWGERSFYARDPSGNPLCFVDATTVFTGSQTDAFKPDADSGEPSRRP
jgi:catechol 2,3-dioxygenase-like lactoylglutathione lyase family enzyme